MDRIKRVASNRRWALLLESKEGDQELVNVARVRDEIAVDAVHVRAEVEEDLHHVLLEAVRLLLPCNPLQGEGHVQEAAVEGDVPVHVLAEDRLEELAAVELS